jgi:hypothetical protein
MKTEIKHALKNATLSATALFNALINSKLNTFLGVQKCCKSVAKCASLVGYVAINQQVMHMFFLQHYATLSVAQVCIFFISITRRLSKSYKKTVQHFATLLHTKKIFISY